MSSPSWWVRTLACAVAVRKLREQSLDGRGGFMCIDFHEQLLAIGEESLAELE